MATLTFDVLVALILLKSLLVLCAGSISRMPDDVDVQEVSEFELKMEGLKDTLKWWLDARTDVLHQIGPGVTLRTPSSTTTTFLHNITGRSSLFDMIQLQLFRISGECSLSWKPY